jgi:hypothetical protein
MNLDQYQDTMMQLGAAESPKADDTVLSDVPWTAPWEGGAVRLCMRYRTDVWPDWHERLMPPTVDRPGRQRTSCCD